MTEPIGYRDPAKVSDLRKLAPSLVDAQTASQKANAEKSVHEMALSRVPETIPDKVHIYDEHYGLARIPRGGRQLL